MKFITIVSITLLAGSLLFYPLHALAYQEAATASGAQYPNDEGKVVDILETTGYTYMQLENGDRLFWIAAPATKVSMGDHIRFVESMSMENFTSKTLDRTFRRVIFVSSTMIKQ